MGRTITLTTGRDEFIQGSSINNVEITINALAGRDTIILNRTDDSGGGNLVRAGAGIDTVVNRHENGSSIFLGLGDDIYVGTGFGSFSTERGDLVRGGAGNDTFSFSTFKSDYVGGTGNDTFFSAGQRNTIFGGAGIDTVSYRPRESDDGGVFINLTTQQVESGSSRVEFLSSIENAEGSAQDDLIGGSARANKLTGGGGLDALEGGAAADSFIYTRASDAAIDAEAVERILDFSRDQGDRIDLRRIDADSGVAGDQVLTFRGTAAFSGNAGQLRFEATETGVVVQGDRTGDGVADFQILLQNVTTLQATDFLL